MKLSKGALVSILIVSLLVIDQVIKVVVKLNMTLGESIPVMGMQWFRILFVENEGMAFGMKFGGGFGKILLTLFRIALISVIIYWLKKKLLKEESTPTGVLVGVSLVLVGAIGNVIDSLFYGVIFGQSTLFETASFFPDGGGYAPLLMGKVVDMFYFPLVSGTFPDWFPLKGGEDFIFFSPVFNFADSCITVGVFYLLLFKSKFFSKLM